MPACLTHYHFAKQVLENALDPKEINACAYFWGAQGPDFFFCHRYLPFMRGESLQEYGHKIHFTEPSKTLETMRSFLKGHGDPVYRSYVMGFLCHYSLDSTCHPYINALADTLLAERSYETRTTMHGEVEAALDAIVLRRETGMLPSEVNLKDMFPKNEGVQRKIAKLYRGVLLSVYGTDVSEKALVQAMNDAHFIFACLTDRTGLKRKVFDVIEKRRAHVVTSHLVPLTETETIDYANIQQTPWQAGEVSSTKSFFDLFEEALGTAETLIRNFDGGDFKELTGDKSFG